VLETTPAWLSEGDSGGNAAAISPEFAHSSATTVEGAILDLATWGAGRLSAPSKDKVKRIAGIFSQRYGCAGSAAASIAAIAKAEDRTTQAIRYSVSQVMTQLKAHSISAPVLDEFRRLWESMGPAETGESQAALKAMLGVHLDIEDTRRLYKDVLGQDLVQRQEPCADASSVPPDLHALNTLIEGALRDCGAVQIDWLSGQFSEMTGQGFRPPDVLDLCQKQLLSFEWLNRSRGWFWLGAGQAKRNRVLHIAKKVLTIAVHPVDIEEICAALLRTRREGVQTLDADAPRGFAVEPGMAIAAEMLRRTSWARNVHQDDFSLAQPLRPTDVLTDLELLIYEHLRAHGGISSRFAMQKEFAANGRVKGASFQVMIDKVPIALRVARGVYALRGWPLDPEAMQRAISTVQGRERRQTSG
jgi:hypothetical protein